MANKNDNRSGNKNRRFGGWSFYGIVLIILLAMSFLYSNNSAQMTQSYSELIEKIDQDEVEEVNIRGTTLEMRLKERNENGDIVIKQDVSPYWMTSLLEHLENARVDHGLKYNYIQPTDMNAWISTIMSVLILCIWLPLVYDVYSTRCGRSKYNEFWQESR